jgi:hypothetical protein
MKLFVWNEPYRVTFGGSIIYAVAETEDQARKQAETALVAQYGARPEARAAAQTLVLGEPTRVLDVPCAEIYEWEE